mgnify:FL=1
MWSTSGIGNWGGGGGGGGRIVAASEMLRPSVEHFQQAEVMPEVAKSSLTVWRHVDVNTLLKVLEQLLHKIKANRRREMVGFITRDVSCPVSRNGSYFLLWPQPQMQIIDQYSADGQTTQYQNTWTKNLTHNHHLGILPKSASVVWWYWIPVDQFGA